MSSAVEARRQSFLQHCSLESREAAQSALDRLIAFSETHPGVLELDARDLEQPHIGYKFRGRGEDFLWKAYARQEKIEIMPRWTATIPSDIQADFLAKWKEITGRQLARAGAGKTATLPFKAFTVDKLLPRIDTCLAYLVASLGNRSK